MYSKKNIVYVSATYIYDNIYIYFWINLFSSGVML